MVQKTAALWGGVVILLCFSIVTVYGFNEAQLKQLRTTNQCRGCDLSDASLSGANLWRANLAGAFLNDAYLAGANLTNANLTGAKLFFAILVDVNLTGAVLTAAKLSTAHGLMARGVRMVLSEYAKSRLHRRNFD